MDPDEVALTLLHKFYVGNCIYPPTDFFIDEFKESLNVTLDAVSVEGRHETYCFDVDAVFTALTICCLNS